MQVEMSYVNFRKHPSFPLSSFCWLEHIHACWSSAATWNMKGNYMLRPVEWQEGILLYWCTWIAISTFCFLRLEICLYDREINSFLSLVDFRFLFLFWNLAAKPNGSGWGHIFFRKPSQVLKPGPEAPLLCSCVLCVNLYVNTYHILSHYLFYIKISRRQEQCLIHVSFIFIPELYLG